MTRALGPVAQRVTVLLMLFWALGPVAWMLLTSLKPDTLVSAIPPAWVFVPTLANYAALLGSADFQRYLTNLPIDLEEAAAVDGASRWQILSKVVVPLAAPGIATTAIFAFLLGWNEFLLALILAGPDSRTLPVLIAGFETDRGILWGQFSAAAIAIMLPVVVVALVLQRHIVRGLTMGAVKG